MSWGILPWLYPVGTLWVSWTWVAISFPILGKFSAIISSSNFSWLFFLSSSSGTPMIRMLGHLTLFQRSLRLSSFWFFFLFSPLLHLFPPFYLPPHLSYLLCRQILYQLSHQGTAMWTKCGPVGYLQCVCPSKPLGCLPHVRVDRVNAGDFNISLGGRGITMKHHCHSTVPVP